MSRIQSRKPVFCGTSSCASNSFQKINWPIQSFKTFSVAPLILALAACGGGGSSSSSSSAVNITAKSAVVSHFADLAFAGYQDSLLAAQNLQTAISTFLATPDETNLAAAKTAYLAARKPYAQTEAFRFDEGFVSQGLPGVSSVDAWEGQVNAWPLDEALIDYVDASAYEGEYTATSNVINSNSVTAGDDTIDTSTLTTDVLISLNEVGGSEANVATGYHAIEFMLWGQDINGTAAGAGNRPVTDYLTNGSCTSGADNPQPDAICEKRAAYLTVATTLLIDDLEAMVAEWNPATAGLTLRSDLVDSADQTGLNRMLFGMGSLALGELASERMQVALIAGSTEDEHECFSDSTHLAYFYNAKSVQNVYMGSYQRIDNSTLTGSSISDLIAETNATLDAQVKSQFAKVDAAMQAIVDSAEVDGVAFDQLIATISQGGTSERRALVSTAITELQTLTDLIEQVAAALGISNLDSDGGSQF